MNATQRPLTYHIRVRGQIPSCWIEAFADLNIETEEDVCGTVSLLRGVFDDNAALHGILNNLYMLGLSLISVEALKECQGKEVNIKTQL